MNYLYIAIACTFCLAGFLLSGDRGKCLDFNKVNKTCNCCRSGWRGQDCMTCHNCGSNFVKKECKRFCQNASFYGEMCDILCPAACLRNGQCDANCAMQQESTKDINQGDADSEASVTGASSKSSGPVSHSHRTEGAASMQSISLLTIAICAVVYVVYKIGRRCMKWWKAFQDKRKNERRTTAESFPLMPIHAKNDDVIYSSSHSETDDVPKHPELLNVNRRLNMEISQPIQEDVDGDDTHHIHGPVAESNMTVPMT